MENGGKRCKNNGAISCRYHWKFNFDSHGLFDALTKMLVIGCLN